MKQYFPKFVFKYQLSINTVNLQKTKQIFLNNVQNRGDQNTGHLDICTLIELAQKTVCS